MSSFWPCRFLIKMAEYSNSDLDLHLNPNPKNIVK